MKTRTLLNILFICISLVSCKPSGDNQQNLNEFKNCVGEDLNQILTDSQFLLEEHLRKNYVKDDQSLKEAYIRYLKSWDIDSNIELQLDTIVDHELEKQILSNQIIREIFDYRLNMGDTVYTYYPVHNSREKSYRKVILNELQFNYKGILANCLLNSSDTIANQYAERIIAVGSVGPTILSKGAIKLIEEDNLFENHLLRKIITIECYLGILLRHNFEK